VTRTGQVAEWVGVYVAAIGLGAALVAGPALGQEAAPGNSAQQVQPGATGQQGRHGQYAGMGRVMGEVTGVSGNTLTVKAEDGSSVQVVTTDNTRLMKDRGPVRVSDLHAGDGLVAIGNMDAPSKTLHAAVVMAEDAAQIKAMKENLGKTYITGRVKAIDLDNAKMTVERPDHQGQVIGFDETTSFKRAVRGGGGGGNGGAGGSGNGGDGAGIGGPGRGPGPGGFGGGGFGVGGMALGGGIERAFSNGESITLADIKVGDAVMGTGSVKGGTFVPTHLVDMPPGQRRQRNGAGAGEGSGAGTTAAGQAPQAGPGER
jgi:hypothetical protein